MKSLASHEGYLQIDNRASGHGLFEAATLTCAHCQLTQWKNPTRVRPRGYCSKCDDYICDKAACHTQCRPFKQQLDEELTRIINGK